KPGEPHQIAADIDRDLERVLAAANVKPAPLADDSEFIRRLFLDVIGRLPTPAEVRAFLADTSDAKRSKLIDSLLARPEYGEHFPGVWHNLLQPLNEGKRDFDDGLIKWLAQGFNKGVGWDAQVKDLLPAEGTRDAAPASAFTAANLINQG